MRNGQSSTELCHRLYLIRHGETVDNVAGLYAGIRDSALTNHGAQQALRLGEFFAKQTVALTHIFSSDLTRAVKTAESICAAQCSQVAPKLLTVVQVPDLREQDFGFYEGKPFYARSSDPKKSGKDQHRAQHKDEAGFQDVESKQSMAKRADSFLDEFLMPLLRDASPEDSLSIAVVSHGILLSSLWQCLLRRQPSHTVTLSPYLLETVKLFSLEHLGGWTNTGYLELELRRNTGSQTAHVESRDKIVAGTNSQLPEQVDGLPSSVMAVVNDMAPEDRIDTALAETETILANTETTPAEIQPILADIVHEQSQSELVREVWEEDSTKSTEMGCSREARVVSDFSITIVTINGKEHLKGLKRTGGGVGSSKFDAGQKSIDSFFKQQRTQ